MVSIHAAAALLFLSPFLAGVTAGPVFGKSADGAFSVCPSRDKRAVPLLAAKPVVAGGLGRCDYPSVNARGGRGKAVPGLGGVAPPRGGRAARAASQQLEPVAEAHENYYRYADGKLSFCRTNMCHRYARPGVSHHRCCESCGVDAKVRAHDDECDCAFHQFVKEKVEKRNEEKGLARNVALTAAQKQALKNVSEAAKPKHEQNVEKLFTKVQSLIPDITRESFEKTLFWLESEAPLVIHLHPNILMYMLDDNYKNLFEAGTGGGCTRFQTRKNWERKIFNGAYDADGTEDYERPRYGAVNWAEDPRGIKAASQYGRYALELKPFVRARVTFAPRDTDSVAFDQMGTLKYSAHLFLDKKHGFTDAELVHLFSNRRGAPPRGSKYKEIQV